MRKVYLVIGAHTGDDYYTWVASVFSSYRKALKACETLSKARTENVYHIQTEVLI